MKLPRSAILGVAFLTLVLVIVISGGAAWRQGAELMRQVEAVQSAHKKAGDALNRIRESVYVVSILNRDYLLDPDASNAVLYNYEFDAIRTSTDEAFQTLEASGLDGSHKAAVERLHRELSEHWDPTEFALDLPPEQKVLRRYALLRQGVRRRQEIFQLAEQVQNLLDANLRREQARIRAAEAKFAMFLAWSTIAAVALAIGIAAVTLVRLSGLERRSQIAASELRRLSAQLRTAQEEERKSLARELHDEVGQILTGLRMELTSVAAQDKLSAADRERLQHSKSTVEHLLRSVRNIAMLLRPSMLDDLGLAPAIKWHVKEFSRVSGTVGEARVDAALDSLPDAYRTCLYRVVQEALTNCSRHAKAKRVSVNIVRSANEVIATVTDDGAGFDRTTARGKGLGLIGIEERVKELGGTLTVTAEPDRGTQLRAHLPLPQGWNEENDANTGSGRPRDHSNRIEASA